MNESSPRRWEEMGLIWPGRLDLDKTTVGVYTTDEVTILRQARELMDGGCQLRKALDMARLEAEIETGHNANPEAA